jgi:nucleoid-associated protein YgaU
MTSDAKIGLLLGLVFIFVIAFIINGLPGLHHKDDGNKLTTSMVGLQSSQSGLGANERKIIEQPSTPAAGYAQLAQGAAGPTDARFAMAIPQGTQTTADSATTGAVVAQPGENSVAVAPIESTPAVSAEPAISTPAQNVPAAGIQPTAKPQTAKPAAPKFYVVEDGDSVSSIAKKVYGAQEGNKQKNIDAIFEANRKTLASIDELQVGQKLVIPPAVSLSNPPLAGSSAPASTAGGVLSGQAFAKVDSIGQRHLTASTDKPAITTKTVLPRSGGVYAVKEGDSLWRIASEQLGDGNRYKDIVKLNGGVLSNEDDLQVGMQLKIPAR